MAKTKKDIDYFYFDLGINEAILDPETVFVMDDAEREQYFNEIGRVICYILLAYNNDFEGDFPKAEEIKNREVKKFYRNLQKAVNRAIDYFERQRENGRKGGLTKHR